MAIQWSQDVDEGLARARSSGRLALVDFNAAPL